MKKKSIIISFLILLAIPLLVTAQATEEDSPYPTEAWSLQDIVDLVGTIRDFFLIIGIILVVIFLIWSGITFLGAQGNPEKVEQAKKRLTWTLIGAGVILATYTILSTIRAFIGKGWL